MDREEFMAVGALVTWVIVVVAVSAAPWLFAWWAVTTIAEALQ